MVIWKSYASRLLVVRTYLTLSSRARRSQDVNMFTVLAGRATIAEDELDAFADAHLTEISAFAVKLYQGSYHTTTTERHDLQIRLLRDAEKSIDVLHRLSLAIRKASNRNTIAGLPKLVGFDEGYVWGKDTQDLLDKSGMPVDPMVFDTTTIFENFVHRALRLRWMITDVDNVLDAAMTRYRETMLRRCTSAISARRRQLTYFHKHQAKLANPHMGARRSDARTTAAPTPQPKKHSNDLLIPSTSTPVFKSAASGEPRQAPSATLSGTVPSDFELALFRPPPSESAPSSTGTGSSAGGLGVVGPFEVPPPPEVASLEKEKICPYCCIVYPGKTFSASRRSRRWRKHLLDDLQPYVCLFENCDQGGTTYRTFKTWQTHLNKSHVQRWVCYMSHDDEVIEPKDSSFETVEDFQEHVKLSHEDLNSAELHALRQTASPRATLPRWCFVCLSDQTNEATLQQHMAKHFETAFILALPSRDDIGDTSGQSSGRPSGGSGGSHGQLPAEVAITNIKDLFPDDEESIQIQTGQSLSATEFKTRLAADNTVHDASKEMARYFNQYGLAQPGTDVDSTLVSRQRGLDYRWKRALNVASIVNWLGRKTEVYRRKRLIQWRWNYAYAYASLLSREPSPKHLSLSGGRGSFCFAVYTFLFPHRSGPYTSPIMSKLYKKRLLIESKNQRRREHMRLVLAFLVLVSWQTQVRTWAASQRSRSLEHSKANDDLPPVTPRRTAFYDYTAEKQIGHTEAKQFYQRHRLETEYGASAASATGDLEDIIFSQRIDLLLSLKRLLYKHQVESNSIFFSGYAFLSLLFKIRCWSVPSGGFLPESMRRKRVMNRWRRALEFALIVVRNPHSSQSAAAVVRADKYLWPQRYSQPPRWRLRRRWKAAIICVTFINRLLVLRSSMNYGPRSPVMPSDIGAYEKGFEKAFFRIVNMGFTPNQARSALRKTKDGLSVDHVVEMLVTGDIKKSLLAAHRWRVLLLAVRFITSPHKFMPQYSDANPTIRSRPRRSSEPSTVGHRTLSGPAESRQRKAMEEWSGVKQALRELGTQTPILDASVSHPDSWKVVFLVALTVVRLRRAARRRLSNWEPHNTLSQGSPTFADARPQISTMRRWKVLLITITCVVRLRMLAARVDFNPKPPIQRRRVREDELIGIGTADWAQDTIYNPERPQITLDWYGGPLQPSKHRASAKGDMRTDRGIETFWVCVHCRSTSSRNEGWCPECGNPSMIEEAAD